MKYRIHEPNYETSWLVAFAILVLLVLGAYVVHNILNERVKLIEALKGLENTRWTTLRVEKAKSTPSELQQTYNPQGIQ